MTQTFTPFAIAKEAVPTLPKKACLGYVESVGEAKISQSGLYVVQPIVLAGKEGAPSKTYLNLLYRPEWLRNDFQPEGSETSEPLDKSAMFVYRRNIGGARNPEDPKKKTGMLSVIAGLAGSWDEFVQLSGKIILGVEGVEDENVPSTVQSILSSYFNENGPEVGYVLKQKTEETGEVDDAGKKVRVAANGYEIDSFFFPGNETQYVAKQAAAGRLILAFEV